MYLAHKQLFVNLVGLVSAVEVVLAFGSDHKYGNTYKESVACKDLNEFLTHNESSTDFNKNKKIAENYIDTTQGFEEDLDKVSSIHRAIDEWLALELTIDDCNDKRPFKSVAFFAQCLHLYPWAIKSRIDKVIGPRIEKFLDNCAKPKDIEEYMESVFQNFTHRDRLEKALTPSFMSEFVRLRTENKAGVLELLKEKFKELAAELYKSENSKPMSMTELDLMKHLLKEKERINAYYITRPCEKLRQLVQGEIFPIIAAVSVMRESLHGNLMESVSEGFKRKLTMMRVCNDLLLSGGRMPWYEALSEYYERNQPDTL